MKRASSELVQETLMMPEKGLSPELKAQETAEKGLGALKISFGRIFFEMLDRASLQ